MIRYLSTINFILHILSAHICNLKGGQYELYGIYNQTRTFYTKLHEVIQIHLQVLHSSLFENYRAFKIKVKLKVYDAHIA